jgi:hypothetical protein
MFLVSTAWNVLSGAFVLGAFVLLLSVGSRYLSGRYRDLPGDD